MRALSFGPWPRVKVPGVVHQHLEASSPPLVGTAGGEHVLGLLCRPTGNARIAQSGRAPDSYSGGRGIEALCEQQQQYQCLHIFAGPNVSSST